MGRQGHVAIPGDERPVSPPERGAVEPRIGYRDRLHHDRLAVRALGDAEQGALERQYAVAVVAGAFREQDQRVLRGEPVGDGVALLRRAAHLAVDEHGALQLGEPAEQRPSGHFGLGDERAGDLRAKYGDVGIRGVVRDEQHRPQCRRLSDAPHPEAEDAQQRRW